ncbi:MAG TPA: NAD(P)-dependent oxidoreductase [Usitatibacter sp.]|jgi:nucleoside-diphosphate-sugar epimerase|nr:NAD(P)-dependent oxidoreductase [Usitatibacter sp.]
MRTAILGGTGSIGMATAARLVEQGADVVVMSRSAPEALPPGIEWRRIDVTDREGLRRALCEAAIDRLVHLAALLQFACARDPHEARRVNVDGTLNVLEACRDIGIQRVVFGSSIAVYGERSDVMRETDEAAADANLYGITKQLAESLGERFRLRHGVHFVALRYSGVFGGAEAASSGMAQVRERIFQCAGGEDVRIEGASGDERVHLTHVSDAAAATCTALLGPVPPRVVYNVAGPAENYVSLRELHALVRELVPAAGRVTWGSKLARSAGPVDTSRIAEELGWRPAVSLRDGLKQTLASRVRATSVM